MAAPAPTAPQPPTTPPADTVSFGDRWAFRSFIILFFLTLIIGLLHYLFSFYK